MTSFVLRRESTPFANSNHQTSNSIESKNIGTEALSVNGVGAILLQEQQTASIQNAGTGRGRLWVRNDSPNIPIFRDDTGVDHPLYGVNGSGGENIEETLIIGNNANNQAIIGVSNLRFYSGVNIGGSTGTSSISGAQDIAIGNTATIASGASRSIAIGSNTTIGTSAVDCVAIGYNAGCTSQESTCIGRNASCSDDGTTSIGNGATSSSSYAIAIGHSSNSGGPDAIALGSGASAAYSRSVAIGSYASAPSVNTLAINVGNGSQGANGSMSTDLIAQAAENVQPIGTNAYMNITLGSTAWKLRLFQ